MLPWRGIYGGEASFIIFQTGTNIGCLMTEKPLLLSTENILKRRKELINKWIETLDEKKASDILDHLAGSGGCHIRPVNVNANLPNVRQALHKWLCTQGLADFVLSVFAEKNAHGKEESWIRITINNEKSE